MSVSTGREEGRDPDAVVSAGSRDQETIAHTQQSVQEISGAADEDARRVSALLRPLHQAQRIQEVHGESLHLHRYTPCQLHKEDVLKLRRQSQLSVSVHSSLTGSCACVS